MLAGARVGHLAFLDDGDHPRVLPVTFALAGGVLVSAIDRKPKTASDPARVRYLRRRPEAALGVDHYSDDWSQLAWVQVVGRIEVRDIASARKELEALQSKYAPYREAQPPGPLLILRPERVLSWRAADAGAG